MADAYGMIVLYQSNNAVIDLKGLVKALNSYAWANHDTEWILSNAGTICINESSLQYPTVFNVLPQLLSGYSSNESDELSECDDYVSLQELTVKLGAHIKSGWIEIAVVANEKCRYVYFERLKVHANGKGLRSYRLVGSSEIEQHIEII